MDKYMYGGARTHVLFVTYRGYPSCLDLTITGSWLTAALDTALWQITRLWHWQCCSDSCGRSEKGLEACMQAAPTTHVQAAVQCVNFSHSDGALLYCNEHATSCIHIQC